MDDRTWLAGMALQGMIAAGIDDSRGADVVEEVIAKAAVRCADRLLLELHKVPAPSGGPAADSPSASSLTPTVQEVVTESYGGAPPRTPTRGDSPHGGSNG